MAEIEKEKTEARERNAEDEKQLAEWNAKREKARAGVDPDLLRHYDRVSKFRGSGLSEVRDQQCLTCRVMLRPQTYNDVRSGKMVICESCQRVLYYNPANEIAVERPSLTAKRRARPKIHIDKAWFYRPDFEGIGEAFLAFVNAQGSSSRRVYDAHTGRKVGDTEFQSGEFTTAFADDIRSAIRLKGGLEEQQLDEWAEELPMVILDELNADLKVARAEKSHAATETSQHPAAS